jgi:hypothetical protein
MRTAFVASTLPALFIKENYKKLNLEAIVFANISLLHSFSFLNKAEYNLILIGLNNYRELKKISQSKYFKNIIIFHECCWLELDRLIIKNKPIVLYYPCVTLDSFIPLDKKNQDLLKLFFTFIFKFDRNVLKLIYFLFRFSNFFNIYKLRLDSSIEKFDYVTSLDINKFSFITKKDSCLECRKSTSIVSNHIKIASNNVIFIVASDVIDDNLQLEIFTKLKNICEKNGLKVFFKNHPNKNFRLAYPESWESLSPFDPFEIMDIDYLFKVGLFSTVLAFESYKSITISELLNINDVNFDRRKLHNNFLLNNNQILSPDSIEEFEVIVLNFLDNNLINV